MKIISKSKEELTPDEMYNLIVSSKRQPLKNLQNNARIAIKTWALYGGRNDTENLAIEATNGEVYVTNSNAFIDSFLTLIDIFGENMSEVGIEEQKSQRGVYRIAVK